MGGDAEVDWVVESSLQSMRDAGAEVIDVEFPVWLLASRGKFYRAIRYSEFKAQIVQYLATLEAEYSKTVTELISAAMRLTAKNDQGAMPNATR